VLSKRGRKALKVDNAQTILIFRAGKRGKPGPTNGGESAPQRRLKKKKRTPSGTCQKIGSKRTEAEQAWAEGK